ncbi:MAG: hypothetical protein WC758_04540 [Candidatus Woesearchaeota archaeon]
MMVGKSVLLFVFIFLCMTSVMSIGVSPADSYITYNPKEGIDAVFNIGFKSTETPPGIASVKLIDGDELEAYIIKYQEGWSGLNKSEVEEYVTIDKTSFDFTKNAAVRITLKIPPNAPIYGPHEFGIKAEEIPAGGKGFMTVGTAVIHRVKIDAPFPGQYLDINSFGITNVNQGEQATASWSVIGRSEDETSGYAALEIFSSEGVLVHRRNLGFFAVNRHELFPEEGLDLVPLPTRELSPGKYLGVLTVNFGSMNKTKTAKFNVGVEEVVLENYSPTNLTIGEINEVKVTVRNLWNGEFQNTYALINVSGMVATTPSGVLSGFGVLELKQFMDTRNLPEGSYNSNIIVTFGANKMNFPAKFNIVNKTIDVIPEVTEPKGLKNNYLYIVAGVIVIILVILLLLFFRNKRSKPSQFNESNNNNNNKISEDKLNLEKESKDLKVEQAKEFTSLVAPLKPIVSKIDVKPIRVVKPVKVVAKSKIKPVTKLASKKTNAKSK